MKAGRWVNVEVLKSDSLPARSQAPSQILQLVAKEAAEKSPPRPCINRDHLHRPRVGGATTEKLATTATRFCSPPTPRRWKQ
jgi:hypothetical protein